jgi:hypothetical protein
VEGKGEARTGARGQEGGTAAVGVERRAWPEGRRRSGAGVRRRGTSVQLGVNRERVSKGERGRKKQPAAGCPCKKSGKLVGTPFYKGFYKQFSFIYFSVLF